VSKIINTQNLSNENYLEEAELDPGEDSGDLAPNRAIVATVLSAMTRANQQKYFDSLGATPRLPPKMFVGTNRPVLPRRGKMHRSQLHDAIFTRDQVHTPVVD
jgi:hypothetical protein